MFMAGMDAVFLFYTRREWDKANLFLRHLGQWGGGGCKMYKLLGVALFRGGLHRGVVQYC